jgi:hypothetical protein|tara:strand:+ start:2638 stop:3102 length:465 start_codon:yes stop_codon:yes gene_type:complete
MKRLIQLLLLITVLPLYPTPNSDDILIAISNIRSNFISSDTLEEGKSVLAFAEESDEVILALSVSTIPWIEEEWLADKEMEGTLKNLILIAYLAGNIQSQIQTKSSKDDPYSGWLLVCEGYEQLIEKREFKSESIEKFIQLRNEGRLVDYANQL